MALGETQIVAETREFLVQNGVALDSFSQVFKNVSHIFLKKRTCVYIPYKHTDICNYI